MPAGRPRESLDSAARTTSTVAPCWSAIEHTMAESRAFTSASVPHFFGLLMKTSAMRPSGYLDIVAV
jgi:hypothetical protein